MSLLSVLKTIGKDFQHVAGWIEDGLKIAATPIEAIDPAIGPIFTALENLLAKVDPSNQTPALVQTVATALAAVPASALPAVIAAIEKALATPTIPTTTTTTTTTEPSAS
jgi:hypothetical protein